jgi:hypothetical protein
MSAMQTITIQVSPAAAKVYRRASDTERKKLELLLNLRLLEVTRYRKSLEDVIRETSRSAKARGLTSKILDKLLEN